MSPDPEVVPVENQATDFAEQFMEALMGGNISSIGNEGYATPLQQNIGGAYESLIAQGPQYYDQSKGFDALQERFGLTSATGRANAAEKFSIGGNRYGTSAATGIGRYQAESDANMNMLMADLGFKSFEGGQNRYQAGLGAAGGFSLQQLAPFLAMAQAGIINPGIFMKENPWVTGINTVANAAQGVASVATGGASSTTNNFG